MNFAANRCRFTLGSGKSLGIVPLLGCVFALCLSAEKAQAQLRLPNIFGDHMVVQCDKPIKVFGWAEPGEQITVEFAGQTKTATVGTKGDFVISLEPIKASFESRDLVVRAKSGARTVKDVLVGEVWICGGQSNMAWSLRSARDADVEVPSANFPNIRFIRLPLIARPEPQEDFPVESPTHTDGNWRLCVPEQVENCSAVGYYFARRLRRRLNVPVGLVDTSWGGTMAQHWVSGPTLSKFAEMEPYIDNFDTAMKTWNDGGGEEGAQRRLVADIKTWEKTSAEARAKGERVPRRPNRGAYQNPAHGRQPSGMYNGMIVPLAQFSLRGVLFYQGENNSFGESWKPFHRTFPAVIADWRKNFHDDRLPFGIIQIAGWSNRRTMTYDQNHHTNIVREIQLQTWQRTPETGLIVTFDTNSNGSIHPGRKLPVGGRSARWALAEVYGVTDYRSKRPLEWRGPVYKSMAIKDGKITVSFETDTDRGLRLDQDIDVGFYIAGKDQEFHHARARVGGNELVVWSEDVSEPAAVRYGWSNLPTGGLMNGRELPAYPFRTDTWPLVPHQSTGAYEVEKNWIE